ncbi:MAG: hypothetical protein K2H89_06900 [Oscillospiraceae bacterium]|nr:hypothetical protein [Oscillospiraceae bacterium]
MTAKEYWNKAEQLRKRINRKIHEIYVLRQGAESMNGSSMSDMPKTVSPEPNKIENAVCKIITLEQEIRETQSELDDLTNEMYANIKRVDDGDARDILTKRYIEFKPWKAIAAEFGYSIQHTYYLHTKALEKFQS